MARVSNKWGLPAIFAKYWKRLPFSVIKTFVKEVKAELHVLNVDPENNRQKKLCPGCIAQNCGEDISPQYHFIHHKDVEDGIKVVPEK